MSLNKETLDKVRNIEGFPIGKDEDVIKLSDPPYYTACPNPFINEFIELYGNDFRESDDRYDISPYAADVSEGKNDAVYNAHSYHTKVPYKAIMRYILHYTNPGDIVFDGFCGTGMTAVAAQMCGNPDNSFKYEIEKEFSRVKWGSRKAILSELSPIASFIAYNYNKNVDVSSFESESNSVLNDVKNECEWVYSTEHTINGEVQRDITGKPIKGVISYIVWSDVFVCPHCSKEIVFWEAAIEPESGKIKEKFNCSFCNSTLSKNGLDKKMESIYDSKTNETVIRAKQVPAIKIYKVGNKSYEQPITNYDLKIIRKVEELDISNMDFPTDKMLFRDGCWGDIWRAGYHKGFFRSHHFYTKRNLYVLSILWSRINKCNNKDLRDLLIFAFTGASVRLNRTNKYLPSLKMAPGPIMGMLYIPSLYPELNAINGYNNKINNIKGFLEVAKLDINNVRITTQSSSNLPNIKNNSVDYIFIDPPFGDNIMYSESNFLWESWIRVFTNMKSEAIINKVQKKTLNEYQNLMENCFEEFYRILKPGRWMTVEFHNSQNSVWNSIQEAILKSGFVVANVRTLDKKQGSFKQVTTTSAVKQDLIISAYKPKESFVEKFLIEAGTEEGVWDFIREHLSKLPIIVENSGMLDVIPERQNYLLYDSMVAFHIQKGATVPLGAADFYLGLKQRFPERDGMYFLPGQVSVYDAKRITQELNEQLSLLVLDEKTAIQWLHKELATPQTYQNIQPKFLQELKQLKYEAMPELRDLLEENFLQDEHGKWYVPDVNKQSDLEKLRDKKLLKEFDEYRSSKGKLKIFRTEAIRAGFKYCWKEKDYKTIAIIGERMPEAVVQEDPSILMYYDNALTRIGD